MANVKKNAIRAAIIIVGIYLALLVPDQQAPVQLPDPAATARQPFAWNEDVFWKSLEARYRELRTTSCESRRQAVTTSVLRVQALLRGIQEKSLDPSAPELGELERRMFEIAPLVGGCSRELAAYVHAREDLRIAVKKQSEHWDMRSDAARTTLYRLLYGTRAAVEEAMLQMPGGASIPALVNGVVEPSQTPGEEVHGVKIHSGDLLVSRGSVPTSALIARGNDFPGNFSHVALVYVEPKTHRARIVEALSEQGVVVSSLDEYAKDTKFRIMVLRPRADLPQMLRDPMLPHKAAERAYNNATEKHIPYDFEMNYHDHAKLFCSEVASAAYEAYGVNLWMGISHLSSPGLRRWLSGLGAKHFETQEPSDLEYDPQLRVVAEWRNLETLRKDRLYNAVTEVMLEGAEQGEELSYHWYLLPLTRLAKAYSVAFNWFGKVGPVPEGMSAATSLRTLAYMHRHERIYKILEMKTGQFTAQHGYEPPYWELLKLARSSMSEEEGRGK